MAFGPGDWVELVRAVEGGSVGHRGKVTSTGFLGGLDIHLENGTRLRGVDATAVVASSPSNSSRSGRWGCAVLALLTVGGAAAAVATLAPWGWSA
ncbi:MAG: hypothetical protein ACRDZY_00155 [Acidimicrobiales bacterium]